MTNLISSHTISFQVEKYKTYVHLLKFKLQQTYGAQALEKSSKNILISSSKSQPLTNLAIGEENPDGDLENQENDHHMAQQSVIKHVKRSDR